ncbi:methionine/alanine import family NSS transporter small subunit [Georgenia yuyongxinii]|uniref:Methionine/alanine import family NSS transporter small subunit n=1 Tax=Georgenia yuyongxinii TaxID=2589797 RepID=A0A552WXD6_9MICO|nr:methionine/alanine import family NSS transporter small subunit [Georgenia yuyongxinii]TRW47490.1 methionine/alanine import family NSS transporter small subunit [Georgenia yuyongxinii]
MTTSAVIMLVVAIALVWGGLVVAITFLVRHPLTDDDEGSDGEAPPGREL